MDNGGLNLEVCEKLNEEEEENFILGKCFIISNMIKQDIRIICSPKPSKRLDRMG